MKISTSILYSLILSLFLADSIKAQDITNLGGDLTSHLPAFASLQLPSPNITSKEREDFHFSSHAQFHAPFDTLIPGKVRVGPKFNHTSCGGCHVNDGKGPIKFSNGVDGSSMLVKVSLKGLLPNGLPRDVPGVGEQLQDHQVKGRSPFNIRLRWKFIEGKFPDGKKYKLRKPDLSFKIPRVNKRKIIHSLRMTPSVIGMGLLEAVPDSTLIALSDPNDANKDGISGKINMVIDRESNSKKIGRFGFKASHPTLKQQSAAAFFHDMGVTSSLFNPDNEEIEVSDEDLDKITFYQQVPGVHKAKDQSNPDVIRGKEIFQEINCHSCHVMTLKTGNSPIPELANQTFHPFTDLLLHDMGPGLADKRAEFSAQGREWRTTPLWGIGLTKELSPARPGFLHDGRARNIQEAIIWHGGEAKASRNAFMKLKASDRKKLILFLNTL